MLSMINHKPDVLGLLKDDSTNSSPELEFFLAPQERIISLMIKWPRLCEGNPNKLEEWMRIAKQPEGLLRGWKLKS